MKWVLVAALVCAAGMGQAQDKVAKVGAHPAQPEVLIEFDKRMRMGARIVVDRGEALASEVTKAVQLRFEVGFITSAEVKADDVRLTCKISFVEADGSIGAPVREGVCWEGNLGDVAGKWALIGAPLNFRPRREDPVGATGVLLRIRDEISRKERKVMPTFGWMPEE